MVATSRTSPVLLCLIAVALATGAGATLVASAAPAFHPGHVGGAPYELPDTILGLLLLSPLVAGMGMLIYRRVTEGGMRIPTRIVAAAIVILLLLTVFAILAHDVNPGPATTATGPGSGTTNTSGGSNKTGGGGGGSSTVTAPVTFGLPHWVPFVVLAIVALAIAGLAVPAMWSTVVRRRDLPRSPPDPTLGTGSAEAALADAARELDAGTDPRAVIERLYARLLDRVTAMTGDLSGRTPEEIRAEQFVPLGVRPAAAAALTRLFEEARYSSHPMGPGAAAIVQNAAAAAATDLARSRAPA